MWTCGLLVLTCACGRFGFDAGTRAVDGAAASDATVTTGPPLGPPIVSVDPTSLPPFGAAVPVAELAGALDRDDPSLTRDQLEIFFNELDTNGDLYTSRRAAITDPWPPPMPIAELNTTQNEEHPYVTADGLRLYFTSNRPPLQSTRSLFVATRADRDSPWSSPVLVQELSSGESDDTGSVDASDRVMLFSSKRGGSTTDDLFEARRPDSASPWSAPVALPATINTGTYERSPHLDDLALVMFYDRGGFPSLRWTRRASLDDPWDPPQALPELDTAGVEQSDPWLSPDLRVIYFASKDAAGKLSIHVATR